jgi:hypothetical protein
MDLTAEFLIYATLFRLAIIGAGVFAIVLGYKLFVRGVMPDGRTAGELDAGQIRLTVKNAAPGTCFALFGAAMVSVMLIQGNPELLFDRTASDGSAEHITLRGEEPLPAPAAAMNGAGFRQYVDGILKGSQDIDGAIDQQARALSLMGRSPMRPSRSVILRRSTSRSRAGSTLSWQARRSR